MKKLLFISTRSPYSGRYSGDVIRSLKIIETLRKKYQVDIIYLCKKKEPKNKLNIFSFEYPNYFMKILYCFSFFLKFEPVQFGLFYSGEMKKFIEENSNNYDILFFHHIRSTQYLPKNFYGKKILDMGDLYSENYLQTFKYLNIFNPLRYIYFLESLMVKKIEKRIFNLFDKIFLFSKNETEKLKRKYKTKIIQIDESVNVINKKVSFSFNCSRVLFVGNLNYLPNILACKDFIKNILPILIKKIPSIKFTIIGNIKKFDKLFLSKHKNVEILGPKKNLLKYVKSSFCGLANLNIATGIQVKVLTYMSYGLPAICSNKVSVNFDKNVITYNSNSELAKKILKLKSDKKLWNKYSKKSYRFIQKFKWKKVSLKYFKNFNF